jgi:uncharacterized protein
MSQRTNMLFVGGVLALALFGVAVAGPLEEGGAAYERGDYAAAMSYWRPLADQGDADAQFLLGLMYDSGEGVPQDYALAVEWYRKAADQGYPPAQLNLGVAYFGRERGPEDLILADMWVNLAASRAKDAEVRERAIELRDWLGDILSSDQIAEAQRLAREWKPTTQ